MNSDPQLPNDRPGAPALPTPASPPPAPLAPPAARPVWPKVIGVLSIVIGGERLVSATAMTIVSFGRAVFTGNLGNLSGPGFRQWLYPAAIGSGNVACMLLVAAGVLLLRRRRTTVLLHWMAAAGTLIACVLWDAFYARVLSNASGGAGAVRVYHGLSWAVRLAYPVFAVMWFRRSSVRQRMELWRTREGRQAARHVGVAWPAVLGVMMTVVAGTRLLGWLAGLAVYLLQDIGRFWPHEGALDAARFGLRMLEPPVWIVAMVGGWLLARRRRAGVVCLLIYAGIGLILSLAYPALQAALAARGNYLWQLLPSFVTGALLAAALPAFLMVWFARGKVRAHVRSWPNRPAESAGRV